MPRRICIEPHLSIEELENRYRQSKDAIANESFDSLDHLEEALFQRCKVIS
ncbi:hypothetical protein COO91_01318 [Nostoc flagelliforme CCNUN1]|uniref:Uncharacterized protein n=1 Tax=Nostoc flagelliforme CCNUN1 TaxID=2038116 RepID=A0A2K8SJ45_9NOSO|nr:hypothetical protein [Nostoc flagelliforme]AUB35438.1 hypothetical protein COO91_01318 [Nostoc flagelliforme CCNUN1]